MSFKTTQLQSKLSFSHKEADKSALCREHYLSNSNLKVKYANCYSNYE